MTELANITIYNAAGQVVFDAEDYSCRYGGSAAIPGGVANGSLSLPSMPTGDLWSMAMLYGVSDAQSLYASYILDNANRRIDYATGSLPPTASVDLHYGLQPGGSVSPQADCVARLADDQGRVQFDSSWAAMHLAQKGQIMLDAPATGDFTEVVVGYSGARSPLIAFRPAAGVNVAIVADRSGSAITYRFLRFHVTGGSSDAGGVDYWIYDRLPEGHQPNDFTLALFDGGSPDQCLFDALRAPMRLAKEASEPTGKTYAICPVFGPAWREETRAVLDSFGNATGEIIVETAQGGWEIDSVSKTFAAHYYQSSYHIGAEGGFSPDESMHLVLDVTNH